MSTSDVIILILNALIVYKFVWKGIELNIPDTSIHYYIFFIAFFGLLSSIPLLLNSESGHLIQFLKTYSHFLYLYIFAFFSLSIRTEDNLIITILKIYLVSTILLNLYGIYQLVARAFDLPFGWIEVNNISLINRTNEIEHDEIKQLALKFKDFYRATSIFSEPSVFVQYNLIALCFIAVPYLSKTKKVFESNWFLILIFTLILINLLITFSLTAVFGIVLFIIVTLFLESKELLKIYLKVFSFSIIVLLIADYFISDIVGLSILEMLFDRVFGVLLYMFDDSSLVYGESLTWRLEVIFESFKVWLKNPIFGVGLGLFHKNSSIAGFADSSILAILSEAGPFAALAFILFFTSIIYNAVKIRKSGLFKLNDNQKTLVYMIPYIMIIQFEVNFLTSNSWLIVSFIVPLFIVLSTLNSIYVSNNKYKILKMSDKDFKTLFNKRISNYLEKRTSTF